MKFLAYVGLYALLFVWITAMIFMVKYWKDGNALAIGLSVSYGSSIHSWLERKIKSEL